MTPKRSRSLAITVNLFSLFSLSLQTVTPRPAAAAKGASRGHLLSLQAAALRHMRVL